MKTFTVPQLKTLAKKYNIRVRGKKVEGFFTDTLKPPTKAQFVSAISKKVSIQQIKSFKKNIPTTKKPKKKPKSNKDGDDWDFGWDL